MKKNVQAALPCLLHGALLHHQTTFSTTKVTPVGSARRSAPTDAARPFANGVERSSREGPYGDRAVGARYGDRALPWHYYQTSPLSRADDYPALIEFHTTSVISITLTRVFSLRTALESVRLHCWQAETMTCAPVTCA